MGSALRRGYFYLYVMGVRLRHEITRHMFCRRRFGRCFPLGQYMSFRDFSMRLGLSAWTSWALFCHLHTVHNGTCYLFNRPFTDTAPIRNRGTHDLPYPPLDLPGQHLAPSNQRRWNHRPHHHHTNSAHRLPNDVLSKIHPLRNPQGAALPILHIRNYHVLSRSTQRHTQRRLPSLHPWRVHRRLRAGYVLRIPFHDRACRNDVLPCFVLGSTYLDASLGTFSEECHRTTRWVRIHQPPVDRRQTVAPIQSLRGPARRQCTTNVLDEEWGLDRGGTLVAFEGYDAARLDQGSFSVSVRTCGVVR
mmetsp:Transcript_17210/g.32306  ORF Transcript_17210/g.32306 Transcript_17210/m.32306 type:complete len:304 (+) Transcript_17210:541-1452(+)